MLRVDMLRVDEMSGSDAARVTLRDATGRARAATRVRACAVVVALMGGSLVGVSASAQAPGPSGASASTKSTVSASKAAGAKNSAPVKKHVMSPYARAAGQREHANQAPAGHPGQTMVQAMGKPHKPHAPPK